MGDGVIDRANKASAISIINSMERGDSGQTTFSMSINCGLSPALFLTLANPYIK